MQIQVKTLNPDGSIAFDGILKQQEVQFVLEVGVNFLMANGATPFIEDEDEDEDEDNAEYGITVKGTETIQ